MLKSLLPKEVKVNITNDDFRLKSKLTTNKTSRFTKKSFYYVILGFTDSCSGELGKIPGAYKSDKPIIITAFEKVHF